MTIENIKPMIYLGLKTGFSFKETFADVKNVIANCVRDNAIGIADTGGTYAYYDMETKTKDTDVKPIYGIRFTVVKDATEKVKPRGQSGCEYILIAKNQDGIRELYPLVKTYYDNFYYRGNISYDDILELSENIVVIAEHVQGLARLDYIALTTTTPNHMIDASVDENIPLVAIQNCHYLNKDDHGTYELLVGPRYSEKQTYPQYLMPDDEYINYQKKKGVSENLISQAIQNTHAIANSIEKFELPKAPMVRSKSEMSIDFRCRSGAKKRGIDIKNPGIYRDRYLMEIELIKERDFADYFIVVADLIIEAKKKMLVGPSRGSSCGSLVCYLMRITEIDPIEYGLLFERFIDVNRKDLPDIDIDFPDKNRQSVIKWLVKEYGSDMVCHVANVSTMKPRSAIVQFSKGLRISAGATEELKNSIIERSGGDSRAASCMEDTFETTEVGRNFIEKYPAMKNVSKVEQHPSHTSVHAAGIIVCNEPIHNYCGVNTRKKKEKDEDGNDILSVCNTGMVTRFSSEYFNLLKIDVLGLRTLSVLQDCAKAIKMKNEEYYSLPLDCKKTFEIFNQDRVFGVFQFEGYSLRTLTEKMGIKEFNDIVAITALARPGALYSGGAARYIDYRLGKETPIYYGDLHKEVTKETYGIVVYQEQILNICRKIGNMSWTDVNKLRKALSKSLGEEFFDKYKNKFLEGAEKNGYNDIDANFIWSEVCYGGNYAFNKSHAVAYAMISYWTAYMKAHYPAEFIVASLNNEKDNESSVKILRDAIENDGLEYKAICPDTSGVIWSNVDGVVVGGLTNIHGIGVSKANDIIKMRNEERNWTPGIIKKLCNPSTPFDILWPCRHYWGDIYENYEEYGLTESPSFIRDVKGKQYDSFCFIGQLKNKNVRDLNEYVNVQKRGGEKIYGPSLSLALKIEDDTDSIMVEIGRLDFQSKGVEISEHGIIDEDWYIIKAYFKWKNSRYMVAKEIFKLTEEFMES